MTIRVPIVVEEGCVLPSYQTEGASGIDLCLRESVTLEPMERCLAPTGVRVAIPQGFEGQVRPRSGLALRHGIAMVNSPGTIDWDYRGEIKLILINLGSSVVTLGKGERVAQLVFCPIARAELLVSEELSETERGEGGFGSTGL